MTARRQLPEKDRLRTLILSGRSLSELARMYGVTHQAVASMLKRQGLDHLVVEQRAERVSSATFIPWRRRKVAHDQDYLIRQLRTYVRSLGIGVPLTNPELEAKAAAGTLTPAEKVTLGALASLRGSLDRFRQEMDESGAVVTYDYATGFDVVPAEPGDRHYVRWPADVPDRRDEALARIHARSS